MVKKSFKMLNGRFFLSLMVGVLLFMAGNVQAAVSFPFNDDMEDTGSGNWTLGSPWAYTTDDSYGGTYSLTDNPGSDYGNNIDASASIEIDLTTANRPLLTFWHRYNLEKYADFGYVEVSTNGTTWAKLYFVTGYSGANWEKVKIDLSEYAYNSNLWLRFRLITNGSVTYDGWYIDDVSITENTATTAFPFLDDMEGTGDNWIPSSWGRITTPDAHSGTHCWTDSPNGYSIYGVYNGLTLAGTMDLSGSNNPQLSFWHHYSLEHYQNYARVYVSGDGGHNWDQLASYSNGTIANWTRVQLDLSAYKLSTNLLVRFRLEDVDGDQGDGWYIDDVCIAERFPAPGNLTATAISSSQINLSWQDNSDNEDGFKIERKKAGGTYAQIDAVDTDVTTYHDTGLDSATTYYYRVRAYNAAGDSGYSNEAQATTPPGFGVPNPPSALNAVDVSTSRIDLSWTDNSDSEDGFKIERKKAGGTYAQIDAVDTDVTTYHDTGLDSATTYYYRVRAYNAAGESGYSNEANATTQGPAIPNAPTNLTATAISSSQINLSWQDNSDNEDGFKIERKIEDGAYSEIDIVPANVITYSDTGLDSDVIYCYRVRAFNSQGESAYSDTACATPFVSTTLVKIDPPISYIYQDRETVKVAVAVEKVIDLHGMNFNLLYDDEILDLLLVKEGSFVPSGGQTIFLTDIDTGVVNISTSLLGTGPGISGSGQVAIFTFTVPKTDLLPTDLILQEIVLVDSQNNPISAATQNGRIEKGRVPFDCNGDCYIDWADLNCLAMSWHCCEEDPCFNPIMDCPTDGCIDYRDLFNFDRVWHIDCDDLLTISCEPESLISAAPGRGQEAEALDSLIHLDLDPSTPEIDSTILPGEDKIIEVSIVADQMTDLHGLNINLSFDSQKLEVIEVKKGDMISQMPFFEVDTKKAGLINMTGTFLGSDLGVEGKGVLAKAVFKVNNLDGSARLKFDQVIVADHNGYQYDLTTKAKGAEISMASAHTSLSQNYPNPFNPETWIPFSLSESAKVEFRIYTITGQPIRTIDCGRRVAGEYLTNDNGTDKDNTDGDGACYWDGQNNRGDEIASGVYFYQLVANGQVLTKKMVVLK